MFKRGAHGASVDQQSNYTMPPVPNQSNAMLIQSRNGGDAMYDFTNGKQSSPGMSRVGTSNGPQMVQFQNVVVSRMNQTMQGFHQQQQSPLSGTVSGPMPFSKEKRFRQMNSIEVPVHEKMPEVESSEQQPRRMTNQFHSSLSDSKLPQAPKAA